MVVNVTAGINALFRITCISLEEQRFVRDCPISDNSIIGAREYNQDVSNFLIDSAKTTINSVGTCNHSLTSKVYRSIALKQS